jgi:uncharacterized protein (DUF1778 family)
MIYTMYIMYMIYRSYMKTETIVLKVSSEEKYAITEAAHEARMNTNAWIREILMERLGDVIPRKEAVVKHTPTTTLEGLKVSGMIKSGDALSDQEAAPLVWTLDDTPEIAEARRRMGFTNPHRMCSKMETEFNIHTRVFRQKYDEKGRPTRGLDEQPIDYGD